MKNTDAWKLVSVSILSVAAAFVLMLIAGHDGYWAAPIIAFLLCLALPTAVWGFGSLILEGDEK